MGNIIFCRNREENIDVQKALLSVGITWEYHKNQIINENEKFITVKSRGYIGFIKKFTYAANCLINKGYVALDAKSVINNPMIVEGAKSPEKTITLSNGREFSESTIKAALKQYINEE